MLWARKAPRHGRIGPAGTIYRIEGQAGVELLSVSVGHHLVVHRLHRYPLGLHQQFLDHGVRRLCAAGGNLHWTSAQARWAYLELDPADVVGPNADGLGRLVQQVEPVGLLYLHQHLLLSVQVVEQRDLDRQLLAANRREGQVHGQEERLKHPQLAFPDAQAVLLGQAHRP